MEQRFLAGVGTLLPPVLSTSKTRSPLRMGSTQSGFKKSDVMGRAPRAGVKGQCKEWNERERSLTAHQHAANAPSACRAARRRWAGGVLRGPALTVMQAIMRGGWTERSTSTIQHDSSYGVRRVGPVECFEPIRWCNPNT